MPEWKYRGDIRDALMVKSFIALMKKSLQIDKNYTKMENAYVSGKSFIAFSIFYALT